MAAFISVSRVLAHLGYVITYSNSSPNGLDVPVRRACFPSTLSIVEYLRDAVSTSCRCANLGVPYIHIPNAKL